ncbi:MAG: PEP-CTERM sorting domain-containing protein [Terrimicrobiaceae bacterium]|nr:PEP-CTERM sorting domain-containing protein [Terrimicrobiaceae bacterium]
MKIHPKFSSLASLLAALAALAVTASTTQAALLAYEGFDFPTGNLPMGSGNGPGGAAPNNGAPGFSTGYTLADGGGNPVVASSTMAYPGVAASPNQLNVPGSVRFGRFLDTSVSGPFDGYLDGSGNIGADGTTLWLAYLFQAGGTGGTQGFGLFVDQIRGDGFPRPIVNIGVDNGSFAWRRSADGAGNTWSSLTNGAVNTDVNLFVLRIDFASGDDTMRIFLNPDVSAGTPDNASANALITGYEMSFDAIGFSTFGQNYSVSSLRIGSDFGSSVVPEPSTLALGLVGIAALAIRRRRTRKDV